MRAVCEVTGYFSLHRSASRALRGHTCPASVTDDASAERYGNKGRADCCKPPFSYAGASKGKPIVPPRSDFQFQRINFQQRTDLKVRWMHYTPRRRRSPCVAFRTHEPAECRDLHRHTESKGHLVCGLRKMTVATRPLLDDDPDGGLQRKGGGHMNDVQISIDPGHKDWKMLRRYTRLKPEKLHAILGTRAA